MLKDKKKRLPISIGVPVFNGEKFIANALDSLINQTYPDFEIIISDNASTDSTQDICRKYEKSDPRIKYYRSDTNKGAAWNFNNTFYLANCDYFKWAAHDDILHPEFLSRCINVLNQNSDIVLCFTKSIFIDQYSNIIKKIEDNKYFWNYPFNKLFLHYNCANYINTEIFGLIRSDALSKTRLIDGFSGSDFILLAELALHGSFYQVQEFLFYHREHNHRSVYSANSPEAYYNWYDSTMDKKIVIPKLHRLYESVISLKRQQVPIVKKVKCFLELPLAIKRNRSKYYREVKRSMKLIFE